MGEMPEQKAGVFMAEPEVSAPAAMVAAIADLVSSLAWPAVVAAGVLYVARNPAAREYASNLTRAITRRVERGDKVTAGPLSLEGSAPPENATTRVPAATSEGAGGAELAKAPRELVDLLQIGRASSRERVWREGEV